MNKKTLLYLILFLSLIFLVRFLMGSYTVLSLADLDQIDRYGSYKDLGYLDDHLKYELSLLTGRDLNFYHGGYMFSVFTTFLKLIFDNTKFILIGIFFLNVFIVFDIYNIFLRKSNLLAILLLPTAAYLSVTVNKEVFTIYSLLTFSPVYIKNILFQLEVYKGKKLLMLAIKILFILLNAYSVILGRFSLLMTLLLIYGLIGLVKFLTQKRSLSGIKLKKNYYYFSFFLIFFVGILLLSNFEIISLKISQNLDIYLQKSPISSEINTISFYEIPFALTAPFPLAILRIPGNVTFQGMANYHYFSYLLLSIISVKRIFDFGFILQKYRSFLKFIFSEVYLISLIFTSLATLFTLGDELTRQLITLLIPISIILESSKLKILNHKNI